MADLAKILTRGDDGRVRVNAQDCASIDSVLRDYFGGRFEVSPDAWPPRTGAFKYGDQSREAVHLQGSLASTFLGAEGTKVTANFFLLNDSAEVVIILTDPRDPWKLSSVFPQAQGSDLDSAIFHNCVFTLDSTRPYSLGNDFDALFQPEDAPPLRRESGEQPKTGLYLSAQLQLSEVDEMLSDLLGGNQKLLTVAGAVELVENVPRMRLATNDPGLETKSPVVSFTFPDLPKLEMHYQLLSAPSSTGKIEIREQLNTTFTKERLIVPLSITFEPNSLTESLIIESFDRESSLTFDTLVSVIPGGIREAIPKNIPVLSNLNLTNLSFEVSTDPLELRAVGVRVEVLPSKPDEVWTIVPDLLIFKGLALDISVMRDMDGWQVQPYVTATLELAGGELDVGVDVCNETLFCVLKENQSIKLSSLFEKLGFRWDDLPKDAGIDHLEIWGALDGSMYAFDIGTLIGWKLLNDKITIEKLIFSLEYEKDGSDNNPAVTLGGSLTIAGVTLVMIGRHDNDGWEFKGRTGHGQKIPIGTLIESGVKLFDSNASLPPSLTGFTIENLGVSFNTGTKAFTFTCEGKFKVDSTEVDCVVTIKKESEQTKFRADVTVGALPFTGLISTGKDANRFLLTFIPENSQEIKVTELVEKISTDVANVMPDLTIGLKDALFAYKKAEKSSFLFGAGFEINATIDTSKWGVIGSLIGAQKFGLEEVRVLATSDDLTATQVKELNELLSESKIDLLPLLSSDDADKKNGADTRIAIGKGFNFSGKLKLGTLSPPPLMLPASGAGDTPRADAENGKDEAPKQPAAEASTAKWIDIKKSLGPLYLGRVGFRYQDQKIGLLLDAAVDLAGLHVGLNGFQIRFPLKALQELTLPELDLDGLELGYDGGPLQITGSFLRVPGKIPEQYDGMALIKAANFMIAGLGSYTTMAGAPSMFIYAVLHAELGGPPFFRVQGLAAGFGYNRKLTLPPIEEVHKFALVRAALDEKFITKETPIGQVLDKLRDYISPSLGDYWLAAGIRFSSFEMIQAFALLSVSFGREVEIGLLGLAKMSLPRGTPPGTELAYAELALRVVVKPEEGTVAVEGRLTDASYIFSKDCRLTGGFAFFLWTAGDHAGDFVVTLGGYHPKFVRPAHYPVVPRLGVNWKVSNELAIAAEMYFALTPSCLMTGGKLAAVYQSGGIKAWFVAYADFLLNWQPFYYEAKMGVFIAVSAELELVSINVALNADLRLWGPPFAGQLDVDLDVISFSVSFGGARTLPEPLKADAFKKAFLPQLESDPTRWDVLATQISNGLIHQETPKNAEKNAEPLRVANAHSLELSVQSLIPVTKFDGLAANALIKKADKLGVRPMGKTKLESGLSVSINSVEAKRKNLRVSSIENGVPEALWSKAIKEGEVTLPAPEAKTIMPTVGIRLSFDPIHPEGALPAMAIEKFAYETFNKPIPWDSALKSSAPLSGDQTKKIDDVMSSETATARDAVLAVLGRQRRDLENVQVSLTELVKHRESYFQADPIVCALGSISESI